jgi:autoinducer 2 (AI-2) kinase
MSNILVLDFGTGSGKCILFDLFGNELGKKSINWEYLSCPWGTSQGKIFPANIFFEKLTRLIDPLLKETNTQSKDVVAISTISQREGMVFIDSTGNVIYSGPNIDMRGILVTHFLKDISSELKNITGLDVHGMYGLSRLLWFKKYKPDIFYSIQKIMMISDWLVYCLCGTFASEQSIASSSQLFDIKKGIWAYPLLKDFGISNDILPQILSATSIAGSLSKEAAQLTGLPMGIPVFLAGGDTQAALIGMGAIKSDMLCVVAGSTTPIMLTLDNPNTFSYIATNRHIIDNIWCLESNAGQTGISLRWITKNLGNDITYDFLQKTASNSPIGSNGICSYLGTMIPGEQIKKNIGGFIFPVPWDIDSISIADIFRSSVESTMFSVRACTDYLLSQNKKSIQSLLLCGGQKKGSIFVQGLADVMNMPVVITKGEETSALGAAITATVGLGIYSNYSDAVKNMVTIDREKLPNSTSVSKYSSIYNQWRKLREKIIEIEYYK